VTGKYEWKNDLMASMGFWMGWFTGLTNDFLTSMHPKIFIIADKLRLDKEMVIANMSGKFKLVSFGMNTGHSMMEDDPKSFARASRDFLFRFRVCMGLEDIHKQ
jgi:protein phosphatase methylesterase 1